MIGRWLARVRARREQRIVQRRAISDALWLDTLTALPFLTRWSDADLAKLRRLASLFLDEKEFSGAGGLTVTDTMAVHIAVQACLPVLRIGLAPYRSFVGIVVHPDEVVAQREVIDDDGVVHNYDEVLSGEAMGGGPLMLSWTDVREAGESADWAYNVVIHEFAHVLDMADGEADGIPPLPSAEARKRWLTLLDQEYETFCARVDEGRDTVLDPYGAEAIDEFFAVAVEAFFVASAAMRHEQPKLYGLFAEYFKQDPAAASP
ncbi:MAG TPA: M90 family metallopeptidase [Burkholderiaceae bacterium]|nr:M90 family metallopeptidase [Burkholderiaceae bacterium]